MHEGESVSPPTYTTKRRKKSSFRYSTMKELKKAREYKKSTQKNGNEPNSVAKTLRYPRRVSKKSNTIVISSPEEGFETPSPPKAVVEIVRNTEAKSNGGVIEEVRIEHLVISSPFSATGPTYVQM
jgi:hypothetical protein